MKVSPSPPPSITAETDSFITPSSPLSSPQSSPLVSPSHRVLRRARSQSLGDEGSEPSSQRSRTETPDGEASPVTPERHPIRSSVRLQGKEPLESVIVRSRRKLRKDRKSEGHEKRCDTS
jgi:hypothetical protein